MRQPDAARPLVESLATLAGTPDDEPGVDVLLVRIAHLTADRVAGVSYASITVMTDGGYTTVAASSAVAHAVDEVQYDARDGPCVQALNRQTPMAVPDTATTMCWPDFAEVAREYGLSGPALPGAGSRPLDRGGRELLAGLSQALQVSAVPCTRRLRLVRSALMAINRNVTVVAPIAGVLLGALDFVWIKYVPSPFGGLGNSIAVWAVAAFLLTFLSRWTLPFGILGAIVCLVLAVPSYYLAATLIQNDDPANMYNANTALWMGLGVVAGTVFGAAGVLARTAGPLRTAAVAMPGAVLFAEATVHLRRIGSPDYETAELIAYSAVLLASGVALTVLVSRSWARCGVALLLALPLTAPGYVLLSLTGFR
jgi:hypothetical protein